MREPEVGELNTRATFRIRSDTTSGPGLEAQFEDVAKRWVKIEPPGTATYTGSVQTGTIITHRIYCRFIPDLQSDFEFVGRGRVYRVRRPTDLAGRQVWSVVEVEELGPVSREEGRPNGKLRFD